jgi:hypothetical protein
MSDVIQFQSRVGEDGVLNVQVNLGHTEAKKEVVVRIEPLRDEAQQSAAMPWPDFVERTYGLARWTGTGSARANRMSG